MGGPRRARSSGRRFPAPPLQRVDEHPLEADRGRVADFLPQSARIGNEIRGIVGTIGKGTETHELGPAGQAPESERHFGNAVRLAGGDVYGAGDSALQECSEGGAGVAGAAMTWPVSGSKTWRSEDYSMGDPRMGLASDRKQAKRSKATTKKKGARPRRRFPKQRSLGVTASDKPGICGFCLIPTRRSLLPAHSSED